MRSQGRNLGLVLGDQLSFDLSLFDVLDADHDTILMAEVIAEANYVPHHPQKIVLIFSAMRHFAHALRERGWNVIYVQINDVGNCGTLAGELRRWAEELTADQVHMTECGEWRLEQELRGCSLPIIWHADRRFLCSREDFAQWSGARAHLRMEVFYRRMRKRTQLLLEPDGSPVGGVWNLDTENRKKLPKGLRGPFHARFAADDITREVMETVRDRFKDHYGSLDRFDYPVTHAEAQELWRHFLDFSLAAFGNYQDAMAEGEPFLFHARISAALNIGLLDVRQLCAEVESEYRQGRVPLNAAEGFIRQLIGWREYVRGIYWLRMPEYAGLNTFGNSRVLPEFYWTGSTNMRCMSQVIGQTMEFGYAHHIQRLMITGNFALLAGILPKAICDWYLAVYLDAFDWVELPNTLGMVMHADGGYLGSKPYCASGRYIQRMSDYCGGCVYRVDESVGPQACPFNSLYWHFLIRHKDLLESNPRLAMVYHNLQGMDQARREAIWLKGEELLTKLDLGESL
ncbi:cryptochrome/photolyase family protein [Pseudomonas sp. 10B1]|uniref:cryptochrome/photolyase family protein n=1 Tax=unclassified Pseudomonas TaxID=196821 RepID=UPI002B22E407|nr:MULTISPECIES: cryptochrome/photolyase family protein [unclassified Pseudomonas]MEA9977298.1 cryptochrome/photolyase family protein [Pseudomonas sp. RTS4]MEA9994008.1 cryptochrome/photolyase family protein [Pseudomonas sp. AA4]MEB0088657.1 cryptochrome/photolyase family protein [Pseudomonas sp. RTI1]MEB0124374.1 cryptochrome/photolyase family protein [Pseudomonas sp. CCC1.2]MEB0151860.1 cryptochrome/photolyase family protein [Pseudomonas sp. CCC4.3]